MIRFCDKEIICVTEDMVDRQELLSYFFSGNRNEPVCVLDKYGTFIGMITYDSLLGKDMDEAIKKDHVIFNKDIWKKGREYFRNLKKDFGEFELLPVLDQKGKLFCFAYQDGEANRELRMLDELIECREAVGFETVYPQFACVTIQDFNELAFYLARYLKKAGIMVRVEGALWKEFGFLNDEEQGNVLDYQNFTIYAEGVGPKEMQAELRNSVSVEFECIDQIYKENVCRGLIRDANKSFSEFIDGLRGKQIGILGMSGGALEAYDCFLKEGLDICCFVSDSDENRNQELFGKKILKMNEVIKKYKDIVFIEAYKKYGIWGGGATDNYHYWGYKRNERFYLLRDYTEILANGFPNVIGHLLGKDKKRLILAGEPRLCLKVELALEKQNRAARGCVMYCDILGENKNGDVKIAGISEDELCDNDICLLILPEYYGNFKKREHGEGRGTYLEEFRDRYITALKSYGVRDITNYSLDNFLFYGAEIRTNHNSTDLKVRKILLGAIEGFSGNIFFHGILENHPNILMLPWGYLADNLYSICLRLSMEYSENILPSFWKWSNLDCSCSEKELFSFAMEEMLREKDKFTSQEIFVMIHIAYAKMQGKQLTTLSETAIYWEPHYTPRDKVEDYSMWLNFVADEGYIINIARNNYIRAGSFLRCNAKEKASTNWQQTRIVLREPECEKKEYDGWQRIIMRFEDLKITPQKELSAFCEKTGIPWSDMLLNANSSYEGIKGFDLTPVYRTYEEYFSEFDRFRISLITGPWQKKYGYPYVSMLDFSRRELRDMFLKKFRFEEDIEFYNDKEETIYRNRLQQWLGRHLWEIWCREVMERM